MTVFRTVQMSNDQVSRFEKLMEQPGFEIVLNEASEIPIEVQKEMQRRWETRNERPQRSIEDVEKMLCNRL